MAEKDRSIADQKDKLFTANKEVTELKATVAEM